MHNIYSHNLATFVRNLNSLKPKWSVCVCVCQQKSRVDIVQLLVRTCHRQDI